MRAQCVRMCMYLRACVRVCGRMCVRMCVCDCTGVRVPMCARMCVRLLAGVRACAYMHVWLLYYLIIYAGAVFAYVCGNVYVRTCMRTYRPMRTCMQAHVRTRVRTWVRACEGAHVCIMCVCLSVCMCPCHIRRTRHKRLWRTSRRTSRRSKETQTPGSWLSNSVMWLSPNQFARRCLYTLKIR